MDPKMQERCDLLSKLGLKYDGAQFLYKDINFHWTDLVCMTDEEFDKALKGATNRMKQLQEVGAAEQNIKKALENAADAAPSVTFE